MSRIVGLTENRRNILVIGNGFDIHHNMHTKYTDFMKFIKEYKEDISKRDEYNSKMNEEKLVEATEKALDNNFIKYFISYSGEVKGWIDFELLIKSVTECFGEKISDVEKTIGDIKNSYRGDIRIDKISHNDKLILSSFDKVFYLQNYSFRINDTYTNILTGVNKQEIVKCLRKEFDELWDCLAIFLLHYEPLIREDKELVSYKQIACLLPEQVISFNYTDTYKRYGIKSENVVHVHGSLDQNNIVLGFNDDNEEELDFVYFKKYFQCIKRHTQLLEKFEFMPELLDQNGLSTGQRGPVDIHILGHSLDLTDKEKLVYIFNNARSVIIYYLNSDDYEDKVIKVIYLLGKSKAVERINDKSIDFKKIELETC